MDKYKEKLALLSEMISFSVVDGKLHDKEYLFLSMIAEEFGINETDFKDLFHQENYPTVIKSDLDRITQFYRLALLMFCDGVVHEKEQMRLYEIGLYFGLNPFAVKRVLKMMNLSPKRIISPEHLLMIFNEQKN